MARKNKGLLLVFLLVVFLCIENLILLTYARHLSEESVPVETSMSPQVWTVGVRTIGDDSSVDEESSYDASMPSTSTPSDSDETGNALPISGGLIGLGTLFGILNMIRNYFKAESSPLNPLNNYLLPKTGIYPSPLDNPLIGAKYSAPIQEPEAVAKYSAPIQEPLIVAKYSAPIQEPEVVAKYSAPVHRPEVVAKYSAPIHKHVYSAPRDGDTDIRPVYSAPVSS